MITKIEMLRRKIEPGKPELRTIGVSGMRHLRRSVTKGSGSRQCSPWVFPGTVAEPRPWRGKRTTAEISHLSESDLPAPSLLLRTTLSSSLLETPGTLEGPYPQRRSGCLGSLAIRRRRFCPGGLGAALGR